MKACIKTENGKVEMMEYLVRLLEYGDVNLEQLFTHKMKLDDMAKAYDLFRDKTEGVLKIAITA